MNIERADTVGAQLGISDRPALLCHPAGPEIAVGGDKKSYCWLLRTFCAAVSCHFACWCGLEATGAARTDAAAKATKPTSVGMITRILASADNEAVCGCLC
jgi:hypothetical protein